LGVGLRADNHPVQKKIYIYKYKYLYITKTRSRENSLYQGGAVTTS